MLIGVGLFLKVLDSCMCCLNEYFLCVLALMELVVLFGLYIYLLLLRMKLKLLFVEMRCGVIV